MHMWVYADSSHIGHSGCVPAAVYPKRLKLNATVGMHAAFVHPCAGKKDVSIVPAWGTEQIGPCEWSLTKTGDKNKGVGRSNPYV